jgi:outer membrane receptor protein involved in Fe transport
MFTSVRNELLLGGSAIAILAAIGAASAQEPGAQPPAPPPTTPQTAPPPPAAPPEIAAPGATQIPQINVTAPKQAPRRVATPKPAATPTATPAQTAEQAQVEANRQVVTQTQNLDQRRDSVIMPKIGTNTYELSQRDIENIPQANAIQLSDLALQFPGVTQDSTSQGDFHIRNEHGNVQYRINGILLPDGVSGFSQILETSFIGSMRLITGALPAQYGLHTSGIIDITAKSGSALAGGSVSVYGGSRQTISPSFEYGGVSGQTEYFATGRYLSTGLGLESATAGLNAIHDYSEQGRFFAYTSTLLDPSTRFVTIAGVGVSKYEIPNNIGQPINAGGFNGPGGGPFSAFGVSDFNSTNINQRQYEKNAYGVAAWQRSVDNIDVQLSYYTRYSDLHFVPDPVGDMLFNNVASDVYRSSFLNGISGDGAYRLNDAHTIRAGFLAQGEQTRIKTTSTVETLDPADPTGLTALEPPFNINDGSNKFGWQLGVYAQDEWRLTEKLTLNYGLRFDQMFQYVDANQFSPRANLTYKPWWGTVLHAGYMRTFTPPPQVLGRPIPTQIFDNTTAAAAVPNVGSIEPERAHVVDAGVTQQLLPQCPAGTSGLFTKAPVATTNCPSLEVGADVYYKRAKDLLDDGQFGQAYVLTAFNYEKAENYGLELTARFRVGNFTADTSWGFARQHANTIASNQSLFGPDELAFIANNWINTDHEQYVSGSGRVAYRWTDTHSWWDGTVASATMIYGSGLRSGFANTDHNAPYGQVNLGLSHEFAGSGWNGKPVTVRFDVVNLFDTVYEIRDGSGIGVFAPQFGPRRGYYMGVSQKL